MNHYSYAATRAMALLCAALADRGWATLRESTEESPSACLQFLADPNPGGGPNTSPLFGGGLRN